MNEILKLKNGRTGPEKNVLLREDRIQLRCSPDEYKSIVELALKGNYASIASYIRDAALSPSFKESRQSYKLSRKKLFNDLSRIGNNLNQIARHLNRHEVMGDNLIDTIHEMQLVLDHIKIKLDDGK